MDPKQHILNIRKKYTGENSAINSDGEIVVGYLTEMLTSTIAELAKNIYKKDSHFIMELIQNADDNEYKVGSIPTLKIAQNNRRIIFANNEVGFNFKNIESICSIKNSTKSIAKGIKGYIGEKGIGFKSVFRVCNDPEVYSNGYQFKFNGNANLKGRKKEVKLGYILPEWIDDINPEVLKSYTNIVLPFKETLSDEEKRRLADIKPDLLLFLNKLQKLEITDDYSNKKITVLKITKGNVISLKQTETIDDKRGKSRKNDYFLYERDGITVPNVLQSNQRAGVKKTRIVLGFPLNSKSDFQSNEEQLVFSYLPIAKMGFRFMIQADFILTSGRESIDEDSSWNHWIRDEIVKTFKLSIEEFKKHPRYRYAFINYIPYQTDSFSDFFQPLAEDLISYAKTAKIVLSETNKWYKTSAVIIPQNEERILFDNSLLKAATKKEYINKQYVIEDEVIDTLQIAKLSDDEICACLDAYSFTKLKDNQWFYDLLGFLAKRATSKKLAARISKMRIIPIQMGSSGSTKLAIASDENIFFPIDKKLSYSFENSITIFSKELYDRISASKNRASQNELFSFLGELGVKKPSPYTITKNYILKKYETDEWQSLSFDDLVDHLKYIKNNWSNLKGHTDEILQLLRDKDIIRHKYLGHGPNYFGPANEVYISECYGNKNKLEALFSGINEVSFINECYIGADRSNGENKEWFNFFKTLGCNEIPNLKIEESHIISVLKTGNPKKINQLLILLEKHWSVYKNSLYLYASVKRDWYRMLSESKVIPVGKVLFHASEIYVKNETNTMFFGESVNYFPRTLHTDFSEKLGFNIKVNKDTVIRYLTHLSQNNAKISRKKAVQLYKFLLNDECDIPEFDSISLIYLSDTRKWYAKNEVFWTDSRDFFAGEYGYCERSFPPLFKEFFVGKLKISEAPQISHYIRLIKNIQENIGEKEVSELEKKRIYKIFERIGSFALESGINSESFTDLNDSIWTNKGEFWENEGDVFYNNDDNLYHLFKDQTQIAFFDIPKTSLPRTKNLLRILNIPPITEAIETELLSNESAILDHRSTNKVRKYAGVIISLIYSDHNSHYENNKEFLFQNLSTVEIFELPELRVKYIVNDLEKIANANSFHSTNHIYISRDNPDKISTIAFELTKIIGKSELYESILLLLTLPKSTINSFLKRKNIIPPPEDIDFRSNEIPSVDDDGSDTEVFDAFYKIQSAKDAEGNEEAMGPGQMIDLPQKRVILERWKPVVAVEDSSVDIELFEGKEGTPDNTDREGRLLNRNKFGFSNSGTPTPVLSQIDKDEIGFFGEKKVYFEFKDKLVKKYPKHRCEEKNKNIFRIFEAGKAIVELTWLNFHNKIQEGYDLTLLENGNKKYFEVKTTRGSEAIVFSVSAQQWRFIKAKEENYSILRVINAGTKDIRLIEINNPYQLWVDGKLKASPVYIELG